MGKIYCIKPYISHLLIITLLLAAFAVRVNKLDSQSLRGDEAATVIYSAMPVTELWELSKVTDPHPPLYYLLLHPWQRLVGEEGWVMRFAGLLASVMTVAVLYSLVRLTLHRTTPALLAATLLAVSPLQIWLAQDIRSYPLFTLLGLLSSVALWRALNRPAQFIHWLAYVLLTVVCLYVHYYTVFLIAWQGLFFLLNSKRFWSKKWYWLASQATIGLLIIPGLMLAYNFIGQAAGGIDVIAFPDILRLASTALLTGFTVDAGLGLWVTILLAPVWLFGIYTLLRRDFKSGIFWVLFFAVPVIGVIGMSINRPFFKERFLIQAQPAFALLLAVGFLAMWHRRFLFRPLVLSLFTLLLYANLISLNNYFYNPAYAKSPPWQLYHDYISNEARPGDVMLTNFPEASVSYYSPNELPFYVVPVERDRPLRFRLGEVEAIAGAYDRIWFLPLLRQGFDEQGDVLNWLDRHTDRVNQIFFPVYNLNLYLSPSEIERLMIAHPVNFTNGLTLRGYQILNENGDSRLKSVSQTEWILTLKPEDDFTLSLYWQADKQVAVPYTVFTHLVATDGFNRVGRDNQPVWGSYPVTNWQPGEKVTDKYSLTIPEGTPPGDHYLRVGWYNSETGERVSIKGNTEGYTVLNLIIRVK